MDLVFTHKRFLLKKYGINATNAILKEIKRLVREKKGKLFLLDELGGRFKKFNFYERIVPSKLKIFFDKVDENFSKRGSFLIIGGHSIVPFYRIKNPTDDDDKTILTDAPYASRDSDFLIPQRPFGRIPDSKNKGFLISLLLKTIAYHLAKKKKPESFGYTASIWKEASKAVFHVIGDVKKIKVTPPLNAKKLKKRFLKKKFLYFNLHGSKESPNWYGQRSPEDPADFPMYPVAATPDSIPFLGGSVVYSEACYGGWGFNKSEKESMALRFLNSGAVAFVGSTGIAYGPTHPPSSEADLLAKYFLQYVEKGIPFGDAFRNAKVDFAKKMVRVQGFLDEDDKKTLLEFQLYGDPSLKIF